MLSPDLILAKGDHLASGSRPKAQISLVRQDKAGELNLQEISAQALIQLSNSMYERAKPAPQPRVNGTPARLSMMNRDRRFETTKVPRALG